MKKHAFLIIAHNEFGVLQRLISALDDVRVDFFVHIDAKVREMPVLHSNYSKIYYADHRVDTRWGDYSQIETELSLFSFAVNYPKYNFYHLISGVHYPLLPVSQILDHYERYEGKNVMTGLIKDDGYEADQKLRHYNMFTRHYASGSKGSQRIFQILWRLCNSAQDRLRIRRNKSLSFYKAANWVSLSYEGIQYLLDNKQFIRSRFRWSFCGDEYFAPTVLMASPLSNTVINDPHILMQFMGKANPRILDNNDFHALEESGCLFGRKFSSSSIELIDLLDKSHI